MATLYYKHERTSDPCWSGLTNNFAIPSKYTKEDTFYLCVVHKGKVYAGRNMVYGVNHHGLLCADFSDEITGKEILLKHLLQGD